MGRGGGGRGEEGSEGLELALDMYQLLARNVLIRPCKPALIKIKNKIPFSSPGPLQSCFLYLELGWSPSLSNLVSELGPQHLSCASTHLPSPCAPRCAPPTPQ